ncbi:hypothetical protein A3Y28_17175 [Salmonella enterica subsp. enterica serovar Kentucky]|nr:hypothetical protein [Salmonella enterica subsp. enterica serovar Kentucky]
MKSLFFTLDGHMVPASVNVSLNGDGNYYAPIERECNECAGTGHKGADLCEKCHGVQTVGPIIEKLVALEPITFLDNIPELRVNPTLEAWKSRNHVLIEKAKKANTKFSNSILAQLDNNRFLTERQLDCFFTTFDVMLSETPENEQEILKHSYNIGQVISIELTFTGKVRNDGIALTADKQDHILLGERYHLTGKVRKFYEFDSKNYAAITVFKLNKLQDS